MTAIIETKNWNRIINATKKFTSTSGGNPTHRCIRLDFRINSSSVTAVALDGYRMSIEHSICFGVDEDFSCYIKPDMPKCPAAIKQVKVELQADKVFIEYGDAIVGCKQPKGEFLDYNKIYADTTAKEPIYKIGFNADYLIDALQSAKASNGGSFREPVILELRSPTAPIILKTGGENIKVVLPIRLHGV